MILIGKGKNTIFVDKKKKLIGRVPTISNVSEGTNDNDLYFGIASSRPEVIKIIKEIAGVDFNNLKKTKHFLMTYKGKKFKVTPKLSSDDHIQFHISQGRTQHGIRDAFKLFGGDSNTLSKNALILDFANNELFFSEIETIGKKVFVEKEPNVISGLKKAIDEGKKANLSSQDLNAYVTAVLTVRNSSLQKEYREALLKEFNHKCACCGIDKDEILVASHIVGFAECKNTKSQFDPNNGLLLCRNHDALFDKGLISFGDDGKIILPKDNIIEEGLFDDLNISESTTIDSKFMSCNRKRYLRKHRKKYKNNINE